MGLYSPKLSYSTYLSIYSILYYTDAHLLLDSVTQQDTGPRKDVTKTSRCQVIALLCAIVITWLTSLYSWESLMTNRYNWPFHDLEWKFKIYRDFPLFDPTNILGTCQKLAGGMGGGNFKFGFGNEVTHSCKGVKIYQPSPWAWPKYHDPLPLV